MTDTSTTTVTKQIYRVYIKAAPAAVWAAITTPEWSMKYGYGGYSDYELKPGGKFQIRADEAMKAFPGIPDVIVDGEVVEADPPRRLVQTWRMLMDPETAAEGFTRLTYELQETSAGVTKLTVTHDLTGAPTLASLVAGEGESQGAGGGWSFVLSGLKTALETGESLRVGMGSDSE
ncbi:MAG: SRPBCC domain-containing protein [Candidatus Elarobacter sp.]